MSQEEEKWLDLKHEMQGKIEDLFQMGEDMGFDTDDVAGDLCDMIFDVTNGKINLEIVD